MTEYLLMPVDLPVKGRVYTINQKKIHREGFVCDIKVDKQLE